MGHVPAALQPGVGEPRRRRARQLRPGEQHHRLPDVPGRDRPQRGRADDRRLALPQRRRLPLRTALLPRRGRPDHSQYRPDFFYPAVNVWHEHWALGADGTPPPSFAGYAGDAVEARGAPPLRHHADRDHLARDRQPARVPGPGRRADQARPHAGLEPRSSDLRRSAHHARAAGPAGAHLHVPRQGRLVVARRPRRAVGRPTQPAQQPVPRAVLADLRPVAGRPRRHRRDRLRRHDPPGRRVSRAASVSTYVRPGAGRRVPGHEPVAGADGPGAVRQTRDATCSPWATTGRPSTGSPAPTCRP